MTDQPKSWRDLLPVHPAADLFPMMSPDELRALGEDIKKNGLVYQPVFSREDPPRLVDGRNRLDALELLGRKVRPGYFNDRLAKGVDPYAFVISANIHRRHLTAEQRRELIAKLLQATPNKSDRQIAETVKASPTTVGKVRAELEETGDVSKLDTRQDTKGRQQPAKKKPTDGADKVGQQNLRNLLLMNAAAAIEVAVYYGPVDEEVVEAVRRTALAWSGLLQKLSKSSESPGDDS